MTTVPAGDAELCKKLREDAEYIEGHECFVGNPYYIAGNIRAAAERLAAANESAAHHASEERVQTIRAVCAERRA